MAPIEPKTEAGRRYMDEHPELFASIEAGIERQKQEEERRRRSAEKPVEATIKLRCLPSTLEEIKTVLKSFPTSHRSFSTRPVASAAKPGDKGREGA